MKRALLLICIICLCAAAGMSQSKISRDSKPAVSNSTPASKTKSKSSKTTQNTSKPKTTAPAQNKSTNTGRAAVAAPKPDYAYQEYTQIINDWDLDKYNDYLNRYPNSQYRNEILKRKQEIEAWKEAKSENTIEAYENYLENSNYDHFRDDAEEMIAELENDQENEEAEQFNRARRLNTVSAYKEFIEEYPDSRYVKDAKYYLGELQLDNEWKSIKNSYNITAYENFLRQHPDFNLKNEVEDRINAEKGHQYYQDGNNVGAYSYFSMVQDPDLFLDNRYANAYKNSKEEYMFKNMNSYTSPDQIKEYLAEFPYTPHREQAENYLAMSLANSFDQYSNEADYNTALALANSKDIKKYVNDRIKLNKKNQKEWAKQEKQHAKEVAKQAKMLEKQNYVGPSRKFVRIGINVDGALGWLFKDDETDYEQMIGKLSGGLALKFGRNTHIINVELGVKAEADFYMLGDESYTKFTIPGNIGLRLNIGHDDDIGLFFFGDYIYNFVYDKEFGRPMGWDVGSGIRIFGFELKAYFKKQVGKYTGPFLKYREHAPWYIGVGMGFFF